MKKLSTLKNRILVAAMTAEMAAMPIIANAAAGNAEGVKSGAIQIITLLITLFALFGVYLAVPAGFRIIVALKDKTGEDMHSQSITLIIGLALIAFRVFMWPVLSELITTLM